MNRWHKQIEALVEVGIPRPDAVKMYAVAELLAVPRADQMRALARRHRGRLGAVSAFQASIISAYGERTAKEVAADHGITRSAVCGIWYRARRVGLLP